MAYCCSAKYLVAKSIFHVFENGLYPPGLPVVKVISQFELVVTRN